MVKVKIERYSNQLEGIGYVGGKVIFVPKTKVGDVVDVDITEEKSSYYRGTLTTANAKVDCPYFFECGGCTLRNFTYDETIKLKEDLITKLLKDKNIYSGNITFYPNINHYNYRNKISLKIVNGKIGFYKEKTNSVVEIDKCLIAKDAINDFLPEIPKLKINTGDITIRCNYNDELLIVIKTSDIIKYNFELLKEEHKIAGVVINGKKVLNDDFIIDKIGDTLFKISYDSFFQVNNYGALKIIDAIKESLNSEDTVLDLYCGVGTIALSIADSVKNVVGVEIVKNAILNALSNMKMNNISNAEFMLGDVSKTVDKIKNKFSTVIVDPPRAGLDSDTKKFIVDNLPEKVIYVSCNPITLVRDLVELKLKYDVKSVILVDMFSFTYHCESVTILEKR